MATKYRISTPVPDHTGEIGGCVFVRGAYEGDVADGPLMYFRAQGYTVEDLADLEAAAAEVGDDDANPATTPPRNANTAAWREHVLTLPGVDESQIENLGRDQLIELADQRANGGNA